MEKSDKILYGTMVGAIIAVIIGGIWYFKRQIKLALNYCYKIKDFKINNVRADNINADLTIAFKNFSDFAITVSGYDLDIWINQYKIAKVKSSTNQQILPKGTTLITTNINVDPKDTGLDTVSIIDLGSKALFNKDSLKIKVVGTVNAKMYFITIANLEINIEMTMTEILADNPDAERCNNEMKDV